MAKDSTPASPSLLIIDDDLLGSTALAKRFERHGFQVTLLHDSRDALAQSKTLSCDLVLLDLKMPLVDGFQLLSAIRESHPLTHLPVLMITANDDRADVLRALEVGANDFIVKPLDFDVVLARVRTQLALNKTAHLFHTLHAQLADCLTHFIPEGKLVPLSQGTPVRWQDSPPRATYRLGQTAAGKEIAIDWLRSRYLFSTPELEGISPANRQLVEAAVRALDTRYQALIDLDFPHRIELAQHSPEDWTVAEFVRPDEPLPVLEVLKLLRTAALLTYENRRVSMGVLLEGEEKKTSALGVSRRGALPVVCNRLLQSKRFCRLCDGLHTLFLADRHGQLRGVVDIESVQQDHAPKVRSETPFCPRAYQAHAQATSESDRLAFVLAPSQEICIFTGGELTFVFRNARWQLLDLASKGGIWRDYLVGMGGDAEFATRVFQAALNLADAREGALFVVLQEPTKGLSQLVSPEEQLRKIPPEEENIGKSGHWMVGLFGGESIQSLSPRVIEALARMDGAVVFGTAGQLLAAGAILRLAAQTKSMEGARSTAAIAASQYGAALKVSEDGALAMFVGGRQLWQV